MSAREDLDGRGRPILLQIGGLLIATIALVTAISFLVVAMTPAPPEPRMTLLQAQRAFLSEAEASRTGLDRRIEEDPLARRSKSGELFEAALARALGLPQDSVRVQLMRADSSAGDASIQVVAPEAGPVNVTVTRDPDPFAGAGADGDVLDALMTSDFSLPAFEAAMRRPDGRWVVVRPASEWLTLWRARLFAAFALSFVLLAPLAWFAAQRLTRPIRTLANFAEQADLGNTTVAPVLNGPREIRAAGAAVEGMRNRLKRQAEDRIRMLAAVAHDLRTPLTSLRLRAENSPTDDRRKMAADIERMNAMISQVLSYVLAEQAKMDWEPLDLREVVAHSVDDDHKVILNQPSPPEPLMVGGDRVGIARAVANLIDNAIRYGGLAEVVVRGEGDEAVVVVSDRGPGVSANLLERVKEPFFRAEASRNRETGGTGLGLAIAAGIASRHGGDLRLRNRQGGGLCAELRIPRGRF